MMIVEAKPVVQLVMDRFLGANKWRRHDLRMASPLLHIETVRNCSSFAGIVFGTENWAQINGAIVVLKTGLDLVANLQVLDQLKCNLAAEEAILLSLSRRTLKENDFWVWDVPLGR